MAHRSAILFSLIVVLVSYLHAQQDSLPVGVVIDSVVCKEAPVESYALYLPKAYSPDRKWPIIYAFDPAARGRLPVELFKEGAGKYGYIVIGSNNSRNGPWDPVFETLNALSVDLAQRFAIDEKRVYTTGFSGGSRAAMTVAVLTQAVAGVIGCGGGLAPEFPPEKEHPFAYIGIVGNVDMNFTEMQFLKASLAEMNFPNKVLIFEGGHQWPPPSVLTSAIAWLELQAMKSGRRPKDDTMVRQLLTASETTAQEFEAADSLYHAFLAYSEAATDFSGLIDVSGLQARADALKNDKFVKQQLKAEEKAADNEIREKRKLLKKLQELDVDYYQRMGLLKKSFWWQQQIETLRTTSTQATMPIERDTARRILDWLWRYCSEQSSVFYEKSGLLKSTMLIEIWTMVMPEHAFARYRLAQMYARIGKKSYALNTLQKAVELGYSNLDFLQSDEAFTDLRHEPAFQKLITKLKTQYNNGDE